MAAAAWGGGRGRVPRLGPPVPHRLSSAPLRLSSVRSGPRLGVPRRRRGRSVTDTKEAALRRLGGLRRGYRPEPAAVRPRLRVLSEKATAARVRGSAQSAAGFSLLAGFVSALCLAVCQSGAI